MGPTPFAPPLKYFFACIALFCCFAVTRAADSTATEGKGRSTLVVSKESKALAEIEKLGGKVVRDDSDPRRPAVAVDMEGHFAGMPQLKPLEEAIPRLNEDQSSD